MAGKIANTWSLMQASLQVLKNNKKLLFFPLISSICLLLVVISFFIPLWIDPILWHQIAPASSSGQNTSTHPISIMGYAMLFLFYFCNYFVITFFNTGLIACAIRHMHGEQVTFKDGFREALQRVLQIAGWSLIAASVGVILQLIENKSDMIGKIIISTIGVAFSIASFFVIPIMLAENKKPFAALSESSHLFRKTWGEQCISNVGFGLFLLLFWLPGVALLIVGGIGLKSILCTVIAILYLLVISLIHSALQSIFQAALYVYTTSGNTPIGFNTESMQLAFKTTISK